VPIKPEERKPNSKPLTWAGLILPNVSHAESTRNVGTINLIAMISPKVVKTGNQSIAIAYHIFVTESALLRSAGLISSVDSRAGSDIRNNLESFFSLEGTAINDLLLCDSITLIN
jgi:hypothetical protein